METKILNGSKPSKALKRFEGLARRAKTARDHAAIKDAYRALGGRTSNLPARGGSAQENPMSQKKKATARKRARVRTKTNPTPTVHHHKRPAHRRRRSNPTLGGLNLGSFVVDAGAVVAGGVAHSFAKKQTMNFLPSLGTTTASALSGAVVVGLSLWASRKFGKYRGHLENFAAGAGASVIKDVVSHFAPSVFAGLGDTTPTGGYFDPETGQWMPFPALNGTYGDDPNALVPAHALAGAYFEQGESEPELSNLYN